MNYKKELKTANKSPWKNTREYIIVHHTATRAGSINSVLNTLTKWSVSAHYVVDVNWDIYKIWATEDILWHAWLSTWWKLTAMNKYSIGIEVIGWLWDPFPKEQRKAVRELIEHLMDTFGISNANVLRHADLTHAKSKDKVLWDWKSPTRKIDISDLFWNHWFKSWKEYQDSLKPNKYKDA